MHSLKALRIFLSAFVMVGLAACNQLTQSAAEGETSKVVQAFVKTDRIQDLQQPLKQGAIVHLKGTVKSRVPLLEGVVYELQDPTGSIWVLTKRAAPQQGDQVVIRGKLLYQSILLNGKEQGSAYIEQQEQLQHSPAIKS